MTSGALPTFIIMGAMKGGTTSLHAYLGRHPDVFMSHRKELNFFSDDSIYGRGVSWYREQFDAGRPVRGEASPNYSKRDLFPHAAARLEALLPGVRLIYLVRDPVHRFISHYRHSLSAGMERRSLAEVLRVRDHNFQVFFRTGLYRYQLDAFGFSANPGRFLVLPSEDLEEKPAETLKAALRFAGADPSTYPPETENRRLHRGSGKTMPRAWARPWIRHPLSAPLLKRLPAPWVRRPLPDIRPTADQMTQLRELYMEEIAALRILLGRPRLWSDEKNAH